MQSTPVRDDRVDLEDVEATEQDAQDDEHDSREKASPDERNYPCNDQNDANYPDQGDSGAVHHACEYRLHQHSNHFDSFQIIS